MEISTARRFSGSKSLKETYIGDNPTNTGAPSCWMDRYYPSTEELWSRVYVFLDGFKASNVGSKMIFFGSNQYPNFWHYFRTASSNNYELDLQGAVLSGPAEWLNSGSTPTGRWVCLEQHVKMNTPGIPNAVFQTWMDGVQKLNRTDITFRNATTTATTKFQFTRMFRQHGQGVIYFDDFAVSVSGRIGCSGSAPASDTTAPQTPTGITIK
ncbi:MAG: hypothetical protein ABIU05_09370 [Nitrospirales bacterium]